MTHPTTEPRVRRLLPIGLAVGVLLAGFATLWAGGDTWPAVLLIAAYAVVIPVAILRGGLR